MSEHYIEVAIPVPMRQLFTYSVPDELLMPTLSIGERVVVPFGPRKVIGIVTNNQAKCNFDPAKVKKINDRLHDHFNLNQTLVNFLVLCSHYYHHPVGDVFHQALPVLMRKIEKVTLSPPMVWHSVHVNDAQNRYLIIN